MICSRCWREKKNIEMKISVWEATYESFHDYMELHILFVCPKCGQEASHFSSERFNPSVRLRSNPIDRPENDPL